MPSAAPQSREPERLFPLVAILGMLAAFGPVSIDMYLPSLPAIGRALDADAGAVQLTLSAFFVGFAAGQLLYGPLSDRFGRRPVLLSGIALYIVSSGLCAISQSIEALTLFRLVHALGGGAGTVIARAVVRDRFDTNAAARVMSFMMLVMGIAPLLAPFAGGYVLAWFGWRTVFWILVGFGAICFLAVSLGLPESNPPERRRGRRVLRVFAGYLTIAMDRRALGHVLTGGFAFAGLFAYISGTPFVYIELFGIAPQHYGYLFGLNVIGLMGGSLLNSRLVVRHGARRMLACGTLVIAAAGLSLLAVAAGGLGGLPAIVVALFFYIAPLSLVGANALALAAERFPDRAGTVSALFGATQFGFGALAGFAVSRLHDGSALPMAAVIAAMGLLATASARLLTR